MGRLLLLICLVSSIPNLAEAQDPGGVEFSAYIENLRQQFIQLASSGQSKALPLYVSPIEIELTVAVVNTGSAGIKFYVLDAGGSVSSSSTQKLKFTVAIGDPDQPFMAYQGPAEMTPYNVITRVPVPALMQMEKPDIQG